MPSRPSSLFLALSVLFLALVPPTRASAGNLQDLSTLRLEQLEWMAGSWQKSSGAKSAEEHWLPPRGGLMLGLHRDVFGPGQSFFEYLRIEVREDGIFYLASPGGSPPTAFRLVEVKDQRAVFSNPEHDFPQRIIYWLESDVLHARIEGPRAGKTVHQDFSWPRATE